MPPTDRSTALELVPAERGHSGVSTLDLAPQAWGLAQRIAGTEFVPDALRNKPESVLACFLAGAEVGVSPLQALWKIHIIKGRPAMAAELMRAIILAAGHELWIEESSSTRCILGGQRKGSERQTKVTWTMDDAQRAKLMGNEVWQKYPTAMLLARATSALGRAIFPDVLAGISYTIEELEDGDLPELQGLTAPPEPGSPAVTPPAPPPARARARRPATRGSTPPEETDAPVAEKVDREVPPLPGEETSDQVEEQEPDDDEVLDAELVDDDYEGPDQHIEGQGPTYTGPQIIAIRATEFGLDRDEKVLLCSYIVGRAVESTKDLEPDEVSKVLDVMADETRLEETWVAAVNAGPPEPPEPPAERRPLAGPDSWDADTWRKFLRERGVKVAEVLGEANRLAREAGTPAPTNLDGVTASGLAAALVGFVEDLAAKRAGS